MKNLMVYINPRKGFDDEHKLLAKIQIDNSLSLGWDKSDILLATNFDYEYKGVKAFPVDSNLFCPFRPLSTKTITAAYLLDKGFLKNDELCWVHDFDAYQNAKFARSELDSEDKDIGLTTYGWSPKWCLGSYFIKQSAKDIMKLIWKTIYEQKTEDERALVSLTRRNIGNIKSRIKTMNITYQIGMRHVEDNYKKADKPIKVVHFHPWKKGRYVLDIFMYGKNGLKKPIMTKELIKIFKKHGVK